jgi:hypothetical protein
VEKAWLRTYTEALRLYHIHPETKFLGGDYVDAGPLKRRHVFVSAVEWIGKEADRWDEDSHFGADEDSAISYGVDAADRERMVEAIRGAILVDKVRVKPLAKAAGLADRTVTRVTGGNASVSGEDIARLFRATEDLLARRRPEDKRVGELLEWARAQSQHWLAAELKYDPSNLRKVLAGKIRPGQLMERLRQLRSMCD